MLNKDINFLKWIAQRLVNKYKEDPKIIIYINDMINRLSIEYNTYREVRTLVNESVGSSIQNLQQILMQNNSATKQIKDEIVEDRIKRNCNVFESLDIDEIIK